MKKKVIITIAVIVTLAAIFLTGRYFLPNQQAAQELRTHTLKKTNLLNSILVSGIVESSKSENVYSTIVNYPIKEVYVEVGDKVKAGDVLAKLDTAAVALDIKQTELNIRNAELALKNEIIANSYNVENASNVLKSAAIELENLKDSYDKTKYLYDSGAVSKNELEQAEKLLEKAQLSYDSAKLALENSQSKNTLTTKNNIEIQKVALEKQKKILKDATITAPIDGTVTLVNAKKNGSATGLLFIVEDTENLIISTAVGEYDIGFVRPGQEVIIKTDGTGNREFLGTVSWIAPAAKKDTAGTASSSNVQFDTEITLKDDAADEMKIGMNARLTIKLKEKKNVYSVPYDAVVAEGSGEKFIYVTEPAQQDSNAEDSIRKIKVQTGMETDMYIEISSAELKDGMKVLTNPKADGAVKR